MNRLALRVALASLLVLAQLLLPFAHGSAGAATTTWTEVCTGEGLRRVPSGEAPTQSSHHSDHCVLCRIAASMAGVVPNLYRQPAPYADHEHPASTGADACGPAPHGHAQARAPPPTI